MEYGDCLTGEFPGCRFGSKMNKTETVAYESLVSQSNEGPCAQMMAKQARKLNILYCPTMSDHFIVLDYLPKLFVMVRKLLETQARDSKKS